jgi:hypothetical protein
LIGAADAGGMESLLSLTDWNRGESARDVERGMIEFCESFLDTSDDDFIGTLRLYCVKMKALIGPAKDKMAEYQGKLDSVEKRSNNRVSKEALSQLEELSQAGVSLENILLESGSSSAMKYSIQTLVNKQTARRLHELISLAEETLLDVERSFTDETLAKEQVDETLQTRTWLLDLFKTTYLKLNCATLTIAKYLQLFTITDTQRNKSHTFLATFIPSSKHDDVRRTVRLIIEGLMREGVNTISCSFDGGTHGLATDGFGNGRPDFISTLRKRSDEKAFSHGREIQEDGKLNALKQPEKKQYIVDICRGFNAFCEFENITNWETSRGELYIPMQRLIAACKSTHEKAQEARQKKQAKNANQDNQATVSFASFMEQYLRNNFDEQKVPIEGNDEAVQRLSDVFRVCRELITSEDVENCLDSIKERLKLEYFVINETKISTYRHVLSVLASTLLRIYGMKISVNLLREWVSLHNFDWNMRRFKISGADFYKSPYVAGLSPANAISTKPGVVMDEIREWIVTCGIDPDHILKRLVTHFETGFGNKFDPKAWRFIASKLEYQGAINDKFFNRDKQNVPEARTFFSEAVRFTKY